jgi:hypothetical protein
MGQRANAQGFDLNRDQMKLDAPESRALLGVYNAYDPHLSVDLHTTNGSHHGYHLTYAPPLSPNTPDQIDDFMREAWLPEVTRGVKEASGWDIFDYGGPRRARGGAEPGWYTFSHQPRYVSNYIGLRNRFGILGEAYAYATFQERIGISYWLTREAVDFAYRNASEIKRRTAEADALPLVGQELALTAVPRRSAQPVTVLMGEVVEERNPYTGQTMLRRTETQTPTEMYTFVAFQGTEMETVPHAYFLPPELGRTAQLLEAHGIRTQVLEEAVEVRGLQWFGLDSVRTSPQEYQGHSAQEVFGAYGPSQPGSIPAGTIMVPLNQPLARVAFQLLEPRSDDGLVAWGLLTRELESADRYPIYRADPGEPFEYQGRIPAARAGKTR